MTTSIPQKEGNGKQMKNASIDPKHISDKLIAYLRDELRNPDIEYQSPLKRLQGGYQTSIFRFQLKGVVDEYSQFLVLRLYPQFYDTRGAIWESKIQTVLAGAGYPVAKVYFVCTDMSVLGGAFFVMDCIPGQPLMFAPQATVPGLLGKTHAELHKIDPGPLIRALKEQGVEEYGYSLNSEFDWLKKNASTLPWIGAGASWLIQNRPPEPLCLSICHGDFHALNIMANDGKVTGVLDWAGIRVTDPVYDVANTIVLTTIPVKHLSASWEGFSSVDWDLAAEYYLSAYQTHKELDRTNLDYYKVRRCLQALKEGYEGQEVWQHPKIVRDLVRYIEEITGIHVDLPS
jgi:aminoglycoside phosphotransferase (APT) family kinase protein